MTPHPTSDPRREPASPVDVALTAALVRAGEDLRHVPDDLAAVHLEAITALAATHAHTGPTEAARTGLRVRLRRLVGLTAFKVALGAGVAAAATTGGLAATGNLPDPVQRAVSDGARWVGVDLPAPDAPTTAPVDDEDPAPRDTATPRPDAPAVVSEPGSPGGSPAPAEVGPADSPRPEDPPGSRAPSGPPARSGPEASPRPASPSPEGQPGEEPPQPSEPPRASTPERPAPEGSASARLPTGPVGDGPGASAAGR